MAASPPRTTESHLSPDGKWRADFITYDCAQVFSDPDADAVSLERLLLVRPSDGREVVVEDQLLYCGGLGAGGLGGLYWSPNSRYFYYTTAASGVPDGCSEYWQRPISAFDVVSERQITLGGGPLAPDRSTLALWQDGDLVLWALDLGEVARLPAWVPEALRGPITWAPDSKALVYLQAQPDPSNCPGEPLFVTNVDKTSRVQHLLFESDVFFRSLTWETAKRLDLTDGSGAPWIYDLQTQELKQAP